MSCEGWAEIRLGDVSAKIGSGATPRGGGDVYLTRGPYTLIRSQNVYNDGFHRDGLAYIGEKHAAELSNVEVRPGDVLLNITGDSVARCCQVDDSVLPARVNQHVAIVRPDPQKLNARFLRYFLVSPSMQAKLLSWAGAGATRNALTKGMIESFEVLAPKDIAEQSAIGAVLGTLDDKIALNQWMNETLEGVVRALFQSWFVKFDPVRAKAEGRDPGHPKFLADLFPDSFEDSELDEIPKGWRVGRFGDVADNPRRSASPNEIQPTTPYIALEHMPRKCIALSDWGTAAGIESGKFIFRAGEILFGKLRPYFHKVGIAPIDGVCSTDILVVKPLSEDWLGFVLGHVSSDGFVEYTNAGSTGTKMPRTNWTEMARYTLALPPEPLARAFTEIIRPAISRILTSIHQSRTLAALRNALLPKLISGELRLPDAERIVGRQV